MCGSAKILILILLMSTQPRWWRLNTSYLCMQTETHADQHKCRALTRPSVFRVQVVDCNWDETAGCAEGPVERSRENSSRRSLAPRPSSSVHRYQCEDGTLLLVAHQTGEGSQDVMLGHGSVGVRTAADSARVCVCVLHGSVLQSHDSVMISPPLYTTVRSLCFLCTSANHNNHSPLSKGFFSLLTLQPC